MNKQGIKIYGNKIAKKILMQGLQNGKVAHAYLVYGEKGLGKKTFAKYFAMSVLCQGQGEAPCLECNSCKKILSGIHPDFMEHISPERKLSVGVDFVRELRKDCIIKPNESDTKVYLITDIQNMTAQALNAFLKTLEEPPNNTLFLLTATNLDEVPETIVSRLSPIHMFPLTDEQMREAISEKCEIMGDEKLKNINFLDKIISEANGNLGKAILSLSDDTIQQQLVDLKELSQMVANKNEYGVIKALNRYEKDKVGLAKLLVLFSEELSSALLCKLSINQNASENSKELSKRLAKTEIIDIIEFVSIVINKLDTNVNHNLVLAYICAGIFDILE